MWYLRAFDKTTEKLTDEVPLRDLSLDVVRKLWPGNADDALVGLVLRVDAKRSIVIERFAGQPIELTRADWFVEWMNE
jgi:hypothetical protein